MNAPHDIAIDTVNTGAEHAKKKSISSLLCSTADLPSTPQQEFRVLDVYQFERQFPQNANAIAKKLAWCHAANIVHPQYGTFGSIAMAELMIRSEGLEEQDISYLDSVRMQSDVAASIVTGNFNRSIRNNWNESIAIAIGEVVWLRVIQDSEIARYLAKYTPAIHSKYEKDGNYNLHSDSAWREEIYRCICVALTERMDLITEYEAEAAKENPDEQVLDQIKQDIQNTVPDFSTVYSARLNLGYRPQPRYNQEVDRLNEHFNGRNERGNGRRDNRRDDRRDYRGR